MEEEKPEDKPVSQKEEKVRGVLAEAKEERQLMEKARDEAKAEREKLELLKAERTISGETDAGQKPEEKKEETPAEYKDRIMSGNLEKKE